MSFTKIAGFRLSSLVRQCCEEHFGTACSPPPHWFPGWQALWGCGEAATLPLSFRPSMCLTPLCSRGFSPETQLTEKQFTRDIVIIIVIIIFKQKNQMWFFFSWNLTIHGQRGPSQRDTQNINLKMNLIYRDFWSFPFSWWHQYENATLADRIILQWNGAMSRSKVRTTAWNSHY